MNRTVKFVYYIITYSFCIALSISAGFLFQPFTFVDNDHSYVHCEGETVSYETSPNLIFGLDDRLDPSNDAKARKLCQYKIINDYIDIYETPKNINYEFLPAHIHKSNWPQAIFVSLLAFVIFSLIIEQIGKILRLGSSLFGKYLKSYISDLLYGQSEKD